MTLKNVIGDDSNGDMQKYKKEYFFISNFYQLIHFISLQSYKASLSPVYDFRGYFQSKNWAFHIKIPVWRAP